MTRNLQRNRCIDASRQFGFTLVEIAIVLVIIGLLLGGVLKGQELIKNAKIKAYKNTADAISAAQNMYLDRFRAVPGDDSNATNRFPLSTFPNVINGNGSSRVNGALGDYSFSVENNQFFIHLMAAGFLKGDPNAASVLEIRPKGPSGEIIGIAWQSHTMPGHSVCFQNTSGELAELVDIAFDDARPGSGSIRIRSEIVLSSYAAFDVNYKTNFYNLCIQL